MGRGIEQIHAEVDRAVARLKARHAARLQCRRGCFDCCVDDLRVFEVEADTIRAAYPELLRSGAPAPEGRCAFLDGDGGCRVYEHRPYVCRTQGYPLRWIEVRDDREVELRDICPLNDGPDLPPITELLPEECWTLGVVEGQIATLQQASHEALSRVSLRDLFGS